MDAPKTLKVTELQLVERPAMTVVGIVLRDKPFSAEFAKLWEKFDPQMETIDNVVNPAVSYGLCNNMDPQTGEFDYMAAMEVGADSPVPQGMVRWEVPGGLYAMIPATLTTVGDAYQLAHSSLISDAGYRRTGGIDYELYDERFDPSDPEAVLYICIPVEKK